MVWKTQSSPTPKKASVVRSKWKFMVISLFDCCRLTYMKCPRVQQLLDSITFSQLHPTSTVSCIHLVGSTPSRCGPVFCLTKHRICAATSGPSCIVCLFSVPSPEIRTEGPAFRLSNGLNASSEGGVGCESKFK